MYLFTFIKDLLQQVELVLINSTPVSRILISNYMSFKNNTNIVVNTMIPRLEAK